MTRKLSLKTSLLILCAVCLTLIPAAGQAADVTLKLGHIAPAGRSTHDVSAKKFAELVAANTSGKVEVKVYGHSQLGRPAEHWSQLKAGAIDLFVHDMMGLEMVEAKPKNFRILLAPYIFKSLKHYHAFLESDLLKSMMAKVEKAANIKFLGYGGDRGPRGFSTTKKKVTTPAEMKGLKLRVPPAPPFVAAYKSWGANPTPVSPKEVFSALKSGMVDGMDIDMVGTYAAKFYEIQKYYTTINWLRSGVGIWMNADKWGSLNKDLQAAMLKAAQGAEQYTSGITAKQLIDAKKGLSKAGVEIISPDLKSWMEATRKIVQDSEGKVWEKGLYDKIKALK